MTNRMRMTQLLSWLMIVFVPASLLIAAWYYSFSTPAPYLYMAGGYLGFLILMRFAAKLALEVTIIKRISQRMSWSMILFIATCPVIAEWYFAFDTAEPYLYNVLWKMTYPQFP